MRKLSVALLCWLGHMSASAESLDSQLLQSRLNVADQLCQPQLIWPNPAVSAGLVIWQHQFDDGRYDLAVSEIVRTDIAASYVPTRIVRLSFGGSRDAACHFPLVSAWQGGAWGWHVAWLSQYKSAIYYARIDKEAWVTSLPKKLHAGPVNSLVFSEAGSQLQLTLGIDSLATTTILISEDEGKNWQ